LPIEVIFAEMKAGHQRVAGFQLNTNWSVLSAP